MFNKGTLIRILAGIGIGSEIALHPSPVLPSINSGHAMPHSSRGKSGKASSKPSGAAQLKRAAKKRSNIRKHSKH